MKPSDVKAFHSIYHKYYSILNILAGHYGVSDAEKEDVIQETFLYYISHYPLDLTGEKARQILARTLKYKCSDIK